MNKNITKIIEKLDGAEITKKLEGIFSKANIKNTGELKKFKFVISSENTDRHGDIVKQTGIDTENFMRNPVFLLDHKYTVASIGGIFTKIYQEGNKTIGEGVFAPTEAGELASKLYELKMLRAVSVGFIVKEYGTKQNDRGETKTDYTVIERSELLEVSGVAVPANPDALAIIEEKGILSKCIAKNLIDFKEVEVKQDEEETPEETTPTEPETKPEEVVTPEDDKVVDEDKETPTEEEEETPEDELEKRISGIEKMVEGLTKLVEKSLSLDKEIERIETPEEKDEEEETPDEEIAKSWNDLSLKEKVKLGQEVVTELSEELREAKKVRNEEN